jgi:hypothetical protein
VEILKEEVSMATYVIDDAQNNPKCSCGYLECPNNGTKCIDDPDEPGITQLPCIMERPTLALCKKCCEFRHLNGICAFYKEDA